MPSSNARAQALALRLEGFSYENISLRVGTSKSTVRRWLLSECETNPALNAVTLKNKKKGMTAGTFAMARNYSSKRSKAFELGRQDSLTFRDVVFLGLYWGEGSKSKGAFRIANMDGKVIAEGLRWLARYAEYSDIAFLDVKVHDTNPCTDAEVLAFWARTGVPPGRIALSRIPNTSKKLHHKPNCGVAQLRVKGGSTYLHERLKGQLAQVLATPLFDWAAPPCQQ